MRVRVCMCKITFCGKMSDVRKRRPDTADDSNKARETESDQVGLLRGLIVFIVALGPSICCPRVLKFLIASMKATGFNRSL